MSVGRSAKGCEGDDDLLKQNLKSERDNKHKHKPHRECVHLSRPFVLVLAYRNSSPAPHPYDAPMLVARYGEMASAAWLIMHEVLPM